MKRAPVTPHPLTFSDDLDLHGGVEGPQPQQGGSQKPQSSASLHPGARGRTEGVGEGGRVDLGEGNIAGKHEGNIDWGNVRETLTDATS